MTAYGIDEAWQRLTPAQLLAAGKTFVVVYVSEDTTGKNASAAEIRGYLAAGVAVLLVYEYSITAVEGGSARGTRDAGIAIAAARALGYPRGCAIAFAVDEDETGHPSNVDDYARAFTAAVRAAGWRSMVYGGLATVKRCLDLGLVDLGWQTYAWSGNPVVWDPRAVIRQVRNGTVLDGKDIDLDTALVDDYGAWTPGGTNTMTQPDLLTQILTAVRSVEHYLYKTSILDPDVDGIDDAGGQVVHSALVDDIAAIRTAVQNIGTVTLSDAQAQTVGAQIAQPIADLKASIDTLNERLAAAGHALSG